MTKWPLNSHMGNATRRYFVLHKYDLSYFKRIPTYYENDSTSTCPFDYVEPVGGQVVAEKVDGDKLKTLHLNSGSALTVNESQKRLTLQYVNCFISEKS